MQHYLDSFKQMLSLRGLTDHTVKSYCTYIKAYLAYLDTILLKRPEDVTWDEIRTFIFFLQNQRSLSNRTMNHCVSQLRFFTLYVLHQPWDPYQVPMRKFDTYLPFVPKKEEVYTFISTMPNLKAKTMLAIMYSSGLRIGEVCHLKYSDISRKDKKIYISSGKNRWDRYTILSEAALEILTQYWYSHDKPMGWLFPKQYKKSSEKPIDTFYLSRHITAHEQRLGLKHRLTCHSFRHAFATHLYENGTDLLKIKVLLGHKSLHSTVIYVELANPSILGVVSPFDPDSGSSHA